jgi:hypothetical protein
MKKAVSILILCLTLWSCSSQAPIVKSLDNNSEMNYVLANIWKPNIKKELWNGGLYVKIFEMKDSKATPEGFFEGYDGVLESLLISAIPDGDNYTNSKLYKIEGILNPKVIEIKETTAPNFSIKVEHGSYRDNKRKIEIFEFKGVQ